METMEDNKNDWTNGIEHGHSSISMETFHRKEVHHVGGTMEHVQATRGILSSIHAKVHRSR